MHLWDLVRFCGIFGLFGLGFFGVCLFGFCFLISFSQARIKPEQKECLSVQIYLTGQIKSCLVIKHNFSVLLPILDWHMKTCRRA